MKHYKTIISSLLFFLGFLFFYACQQEVVYEQRANTGAAGNDANTGSENNNDNAATQDDDNNNDDGVANASSFSMSWDQSTDASILSYKIFFVPPDSNPRYPNASGVPIEIKNYPLADLTPNGGKYTITVTDDEVKAALGTTSVEQNQYCFSLVAVNNIGNSVHSTKICP